jgi:hypothetical protein
MRKPSLPRPPAGLGTPERKFWHEIVNGWALDEAALEILATACRAKQREREAREQIVTDGATFLDRFGQRKVSPSVLIERDAQGTFIRAMAALKLDVMGPAGRPPRGARMNIRRRYQARRESLGLSAAWRWLLEHGEMPPDAIMGPDDDAVDLYRALHPRSQDAEARWHAWGHLILRAWRRARRPGRPWGAERFGDPGGPAPGNGQSHTRQEIRR